MKNDLSKIIEFQEQRDWKQFHLPKNLAISLTIEASEILEIFQWTKDNNIPKDKKLQLEEEIADVYYYLLLLAHETGVDIKKAFKNKMKVNAKKYPTHKARGNSKKYTELK
jgi:NTP pyrophosphatase (non-canonical NTP hydrolase)